jgi:hypothetical protein
MIALFPSATYNESRRYVRSRERLQKRGSAKMVGPLELKASSLKDTPNVRPSEPCRACQGLLWWALFVLDGAKHAKWKHLRLEVHSE